MKTSVSLSAKVLKQLDQEATDKGQRSALVEQAVVEFFERRRREKRDEKDRKIYEEHADEINRETEEIMGLVAEANAYWAAQPAEEKSGKSVKSRRKAK